MEKINSVFRVFALFTAVFFGLWTTLYSALAAVYPIKYKNIVNKYSEEFDVDRQLVYSIMKNESGFSEKSVSAKNAVGLMQLTPDTAAWIADKMNIREYSLYDPETNILFSCWYLKYLCGLFGNTETAVAAYNAGEGNVKKWLNNKKYSTDGIKLACIPFDETEKYVDNVMSAYNIYKKLY